MKKNINKLLDAVDQEAKEQQKEEKKDHGYLITPFIILLIIAGFYVINKYNPKFGDVMEPNNISENESAYKEVINNIPSYCNGTIYVHYNRNYREYEYYCEVK